MQILTVCMPAKKSRAVNNFEVESVLYYCGHADGVCRTDSRVFEFSVDETSSARNV